jgi:hypothetical protein
MARIQTYDWIIPGVTPIFVLVRCSKFADSPQKNEGKCAMKMTDQMERDFFQAEMTSGRANHGSELTDLIVATTVIGVLLFASIVMISFGH